MIRPGLIALTCAIAPPALAQTSLFSIGFGDEVIVAEASDITSVSSGLDHRGQPGLRVVFSRRFTALITDMTGRQIGHSGFVSICDQIISRPVLMDQMHHLRELTLSMPETDEAARLAKILTRGTCDQM